MLTAPYDSRKLQCGQEAAANFMLREQYDYKQGFRSRLKCLEGTFIFHVRFFPRCFMFPEGTTCWNITYELMTRCSVAPARGR